MCTKISICVNGHACVSYKKVTNVYVLLSIRVQIHIKHKREGEEVRDCVRLHFDCFASCSGDSDGSI